MFYRIFIVIWLIIFGFMLDGRCLFASDKTQPVSNDRKVYQAFMPGEILIKTHPHVTQDQINSLNRDHTAKILEGHPKLNLYRLKVSESAGDATISYQSHSAVEYAQPNYIFAEIGEEYITLFDLDLAIQKMIPLFHHRYKELQAKEKLLRTLLNDKLFLQAAKDEDLATLPEVQSEIDKAIEKTLARIYQRRIQAGTVSEKEIVAYYEKHKQDFKNPEQIRGRRILVTSKQEAEEILEQLKAGSDFYTLAREKSKDPTAQYGGRFGWISGERMPPAIEKAVFDLNKGEISNAIPTQSGYYIFKIEDKRAPGNKPFSEVKAKIKRKLEAANQKKAFGNKIKELEEKYQVKLSLEFLSEVKVSVSEKIGQQDTDSIQKLREVLQKAIERPYD